MLTVTPDKEMDIPLGLEFDRFRWIDIQIRWYQGSKLSEDVGMRQLISLLRYGRPQMLPYMTIQFSKERDRSTGWSVWTTLVLPGSTFCWATKNYDSDDEPDNSVISQNWRPYYSGLEDRTETWLRPWGCHGNPITVDLLDYFLVLPPCRGANVRYIPDLDLRRPKKPRHNCKRRIFDDKYMMNLWDALEFWLEGHREGMKLPEPLSDFGEPPLEQLAYTIRDGAYYAMVSSRSRNRDQTQGRRRRSSSSSKRGLNWQ